MVQIEEKQRFSKKFRKRKLIIASCCVCIFLYKNSVQPVHAKMFSTPDSFSEYSDTTAGFWEILKDSYEGMTEEFEVLAAFVLLRKRPIYRRRPCCSFNCEIVEKVQIYQLNKTNWVFQLF